MIDYDQLKTDIESGDINDRNIVCEIGKGGIYVSILKWLSDVAASVASIVTNTGSALITAINATTTAVNNVLTSSNNVAVNTLAIVNNTTPSVRSANTTLATSNGSVSTNSSTVIFYLSSDFNGTIDGVAVSPLITRQINYGANTGDLINAIPYTISAGSLLIVQVQ